MPRQYWAFTDFSEVFFLWGRIIVLYTSLRVKKELGVQVYIYFEFSDETKIELFVHDDQNYRGTLYQMFSLVVVASCSGAVMLPVELVNRKIKIIRVLEH